MTRELPVRTHHQRDPDVLSNHLVHRRCDTTESSRFLPFIQPQRVDRSTCCYEVVQLYYDRYAQGLPSDT